MQLSRILMLTIGGLGVIAISFFGTLAAIDRNLPGFGAPDFLDRQRAGDAATLKSALEKYRSARGSYPKLPDNPVDDLKAELVGGGFLKEIPRDPAGKGYRYASYG